MCILLTAECCCRIMTATGQSTDVNEEDILIRRRHITMKVSDFYPIFYADDIEAGIRRFTEDLGFTVKHRPQIEFLDYAVLENDKNRRADIVCSHFPADSFSEGFLGMRVNVDDFDEGVSYFGTQGYSMFGTAHETDSSVTALLTKGDGTYMVLFQHK